jgi:hypothetical protein
LLKAQVSCFGDPADFFYDDVSQVKATGKHTDPKTYESNAIQSLPYQKQLFTRLNPELILIGGQQAFDAYCKIILPELQYDSLIIVKLRNPSPQAHRGQINRWLDKYQALQISLTKKEGLPFFHLKCSNIASNFALCEIAPRLSNH